jgi:hypothetical protein
MGSLAIPLLQYSIPPAFYPLLGMLAGYLVVMRANPVRIALRDGFRCLLRFKRLWLVFALLALAYSAFQFVVFTQLHPRERERVIAQAADLLAGAGGRPFSLPGAFPPDLGHG